MNLDFVHLHVHSCYSLLDGMIPVRDLAAKAKKEGMKSLALTDHGNMFGIIEFYEACHEHGIKPVLGCEVYVAVNDRTIKHKTDKEENYYHLVLLACSNEGYKNLSKIVSDSWLVGFYYKPRTDLKFLSEHSKGLIALSACLGGQVPYLIKSGDLVGAENAALQLKEIFKDGFYLELQNNGLEKQKLVNEELISLGKRLDIPLVATNDIHFLERDDFEAHEVLLAANRKMTLAEARQSSDIYFTPEVYFKSIEEMHRDFEFCPEAIENTVNIASHCKVELDFKTLHFPRFSVPEGYDENSWFEKKVWEGVRERYPQITDAVRERVEKEIKIIKDMNFAGYFLIVSDFVNFARNNDIPVGPGRGSAAGSVVSYALKITDIDPLKYNLLFERFLNPERKSMPDIDIDFAHDRREEILSYLRKKYGENNVAQIVTYNTMGLRVAIRDTARVFGLSPSEGDKLAKLIPERMTSAEVMADKNNTALQKELESEEQSRKIFFIASKLENIIRQHGKHAAGVLISDVDISEYIPLCLDNDKNILSQYDKDRVEKIGLIKMDLLGLITLSVLRDALKEIKKTENKDIDLNKIPLNDKKTFHLLQKGRTVGIFQMESSKFTKTIISLKPTTMEDLAVLVALNRPGPMKAGVVDSYIRRKHGYEPVTYPHKLLVDILSETYGKIVYQEQVMQIAQVMSGYTLARADNLRKAIGKKNEAIMKQELDKLLDGAKKNNIDEKTANEIISQIKEFAEYAFNKSHSVAYAYLAYQTAYLKAHYPVEFMASLLTHEMLKQENLIKNINEARALNIHILNPDINKSYEYFTVVKQPDNKKAICFCLAAIKGVGQKAVSAIVEEREKNGPYKDFLDFCVRVDSHVVNKKAIEALIKVGAFDSIEPNRAKLYANCNDVLDWAAVVKGHEQTGQIYLFSSKIAFKYKEVPDWDEIIKLDYERELLGFYVSNHPLKRYSSVLNRLKMEHTSTISELPENSIVRLVGMIINIKDEIVKEKYPKISFELEDFYGKVKVDLWGELLINFRDKLKERMVVMVEGKIRSIDKSYFITATRLFLFENLSEKDITHIHIQIPEIGLDEEVLLKLKEELLANAGQAKVFLHFVNMKENDYEKNVKILKVDEKIRCYPNKKLLSMISQYFGEDSYWYEIKK